MTTHAEYYLKQLVDGIDATRVELLNAATRSSGQAQETHLSLTGVRRDLNDVGQILGEISGSLSSITYSVDTLLPTILSEVMRNSTISEQLLQATQNPTATAGEEFRERGFLALRNRWFTEAESDFLKSIELYPYDARAHFGLALTLLQVEKASERAAQSFRLAAKYGSADRPSLATVAAVAAADLFDQTRRPDVACSTLREALETLGPAPDVAFAVAIRTRQKADLVTALELDPRLVVEPRISDFSYTGAAAEEVLYGKAGFASLYGDAVEYSRSLDQYLRQQGKPGLGVPLEIPKQASFSAQLALFAGQRKAAKKRLLDAISQVETQLNELDWQASRKLHQAAGRSVPWIPSEPKKPSISGTAKTKLLVGVVLFAIAIVAVLRFQQHTAILHETGQDTSPGNVVLGLVAWGAAIILGITVLGFLGASWNESKENHRALTKWRNDLHEYKERKAERDTQEWRKGKDVNALENHAEQLRRQRTEIAESLLIPARKVAESLDWPVIEGISLGLKAMTIPPLPQS